MGLQLSIFTTSVLPLSSRFVNRINLIASRWMISLRWWPDRSCTGASTTWTCAPTVSTASTCCAILIGWNGARSETKRTCVGFHSGIDRGRVWGLGSNDCNTNFFDSDLGWCDHVPKLKFQICMAISRSIRVSRPPSNSSSYPPSPSYLGDPAPPPPIDGYVFFFSLTFEMQRKQVPLPERGRQPAPTRRLAHVRRGVEASRRPQPVGAGARRKPVDLRLRHRSKLAGAGPDDSDF